MGYSIHVTRGVKCLLLPLVVTSIICFIKQVPVSQSFVVTVPGMGFLVLCPMDVSEPEMTKSVDVLLVFFASSPFPTSTTSHSVNVPPIYSVSGILHLLSLLLMFTIFNIDVPRFSSTTYVIWRKKRQVILHSCR